MSSHGKCRKSYHGVAGGRLHQPASLSGAQVTKMDPKDIGNLFDRLCGNIREHDKGFIMKSMGDGDKVEDNGREVGTQ